MHGLSATLLLVALLLAGPSVDARVTGKQKREILSLHNRARRRVSPSASNMKDLTWDESLARKAQAWADRCTMGHNPTTSISGRWDWVGENIAYSTRGVISQMVGGWEGEKEVYNYRSNTCNPIPGDPMKASCGHYTQLVWADTTKVGCAFKKGCPGVFKDRLICNYGPGGNWVGEKPYKSGGRA